MGLGIRSSNAGAIFATARRSQSGAACVQAPREVTSLLPRRAARSIHTAARCRSSRMRKQRALALSSLWNRSRRHGHNPIRPADAAAAYQKAERNGGRSFKEANIKRNEASPRSRPLIPLRRYRCFASLMVLMWPVACLSRPRRWRSPWRRLSQCGRRGLRQAAPCRIRQPSRVTALGLRPAKQNLPPA
jgi:hypothetical protein